MFPMPHTNGQSAKFRSTIARVISDKQHMLNDHQQQWERVKAAGSTETVAVTDATETGGAASLMDELAAYKRRTREELVVKARVFNTKRVPAALTMRATTRRPYTVRTRRGEVEADDGVEWRETDAARDTVEPSNRRNSRARMPPSTERAQRVSTSERHQQPRVPQRKGGVIYRRSAESTTHRSTENTATPTNHRDAGRVRSSSSRRSTRPAPASPLSSETLSSLLDTGSGLSSSTKQMLQNMQREQRQNVTSRQAERSGH